MKGVEIAATEELLSVPEVGDRLGVSVYTVRRWIKSGDLAAYRPGKEYRIRESELETFLEAHRPKDRGPLSEAEQRASRQHEGLVNLHKSTARLGRSVASSFTNFQKADVERLVVFGELTTSLAKMRGPRDIWGNEPEDLSEAVGELEEVEDLVQTALQEHLDLLPQDARLVLEELKERAEVL